jgi:hypothetical protein
VSTDVDAPPPPTRSGSTRYVWLAAGLVVALIALFGLYRLGVLGGGDAEEAAPDFPTQLTGRVVGLLEQMPAEGHGHGHAVAEDAKGNALVCGFRAFGTVPADADALDEVAKVFGYHMCAIPERGLHWNYSYKLTGPIAVTLAADPPTITVAEGGEGYRDRVQKLIPPPYTEEAYNASLTPEGMQELIRRYDEAAKD